MKAFVLAIGVVVTTWMSGGVARAQDAGSAGGACYGNGTCNAGLACQAGTCVAPEAGALGGPCYGNSTCNAGMACDPATQTCVAAGAPAATAPPVGGGMTPAPAAGTGAGGGSIDSMSPAAPAPAVAATPVMAAPISKRWWVTAKAGFLMAGSADFSTDAGDAEFDTDSGLLVNLGVDVAMGPRLCIGGLLLYASTGLEGEVDAHVITVGGTLKGRFPAGNFEIRPGVLAGYQMIGGEAFEGTDDSQGLGIGGLVELAIPMSPQADFVGELGFLTQPTGGNDDVDITFGPTFFIAGGASFGG
jgi:hypothetical protein